MVLKCKYLLKIYEDPWGDECLVKILTASSDLRPDEGKIYHNIRASDPILLIISRSFMTEKEFHNNEMGPIMTVRLQKLCDTDLEKLALKYSESCLRCIPDDTVPYKDTRNLVFDINLGLLVSLGKTNEFVEKVSVYLIFLCF